MSCRLTLTPFQSESWMKNFCSLSRQGEHIGFGESSLALGPSLAPSKVPLSRYANHTLRGGTDCAVASPFALGDIMFCQAATYALTNKETHHRLTATARSSLPIACYSSCPLLVRQALVVRQDHVSHACHLGSQEARSHPRGGPRVALEWPACRCLARLGKGYRTHNINGASVASG